MSKIFRFVLVATLAVAFLVPVASAQTKTEKVVLCWPVYYDTTCTGDWILWDSTATNDSIVVGPGDTIKFKVMNVEVPKNKKKAWIDLDGDSVFIGLNAIDSILGYYAPPDTVRHGSKVSKSPYGSAGVTFKGILKKQPKYEVFILKNKTTHTAIIRYVKGCSQCEKRVDVPSLTTYGIILLVLLLLASTVWVIRKKRAGAPA